MNFYICFVRVSAVVYRPVIHSVHVFFFVESFWDGCSSDTMNVAESVGLRKGVLRLVILSVSLLGFRGALFVEAKSILKSGLKDLSILSLSRSSFGMNCGGICNPRFK